MAYKKQGPMSRYGEKLKDPRWQKLRLEIYQRDDFTCQLCGAKDKMLAVHHAAYCPWDSDPWKTSKDVLFTACADCHEPEHELHRNSLYSLIEYLGECGIRSSRDIELLTDNADQNLFYLVPPGTNRYDTTVYQRLRALAEAILHFAENKQKAIDAGDWYGV